MAAAPPKVTGGTPLGRLDRGLRAQAPAPQGRNQGANMSHIDFLSRIALVAGAFAALSAATPAMAGCNSGNLPNTYLLNTSGCQANASGAGATAIGDAAVATGFSSTALGLFSRAEGRYSTAIGAGDRFSLLTHPHALGDYSIAIGAGSGDFGGPHANGYRSIAVGQKSVSADFDTSVGFNTNTKFASTAIGTDAQALADSSTALGRFAKASATSSLALGHGAVANKARAVAIGSGSLANVADTVSIGTNTARRRIVNVQHGIANTDAATLGQVKAIATAAAETANADLQRDVAELRTLVKQQQARLDLQHQEIAELKVQRSAALAD